MVFPQNIPTRTVSWPEVKNPYPSDPGGERVLKIKWNCLIVCEDVIVLSELPIFLITFLSVVSCVLSFEFVEDIPQQGIVLNSVVFISCLV